MELIYPTWPAPAHIQAVSTTRQGGISQLPFSSLNLGVHVGDHEADVLQNRMRLTQALALVNSPVWLNQIHSSKVVTLPLCHENTVAEPMVRLQHSPFVDADASFTQSVNQVCVVMTADCLPVLFCDREGKQVAAAHAGWRGLANGILENTLAHFSNPHDVMAWLGPAIGPQAFEVGDEVRAAFIAHDPSAEMAFKPHQQKWLADIYTLARLRLKAAGLTQIYGGDYCTMTDQTRFFSYRRSGQTGRQASLIWITDQASIII